MHVGVLRQPEVAHRLDAETGGLVLCGKTTAGIQGKASHFANEVCENLWRTVLSMRSCGAGLSRAFAARSIVKRYRALVRGNLQGCGRITLPISGAPSSTEYRSVAVEASSKCMHVTVVDLWPLTGRTHQLRKHMAYLGHPILGDRKYWGTPKVSESQLACHVAVLEESALAASSEREAAVLRGEGDGCTTCAADDSTSALHEPSDCKHDAVTRVEGAAVQSERGQQEAAHSRPADPGALHATAPAEVDAFHGDNGQV